MPFPAINEPFAATGHYLMTLVDWFSKLIMCIFFPPLTVITCNGPSSSTLVVVAMPEKKTFPLVTSIVRDLLLLEDLL